MFAIRAVLAATLSPSWGVYSGFELFEDEPVRAGQRGVPGLGEVPAAAAGLHQAALREGRSLEPLIRRLNLIRREHRALQQMKGLWFHWISNDSLLCYSRRDQLDRRHRSWWSSRWIARASIGERPSCGCRRWACRGPAVSTWSTSSPARSTTGVSGTPWSALGAADLACAGTSCTFRTGRGISSVRDLDTRRGHELCGTRRARHARAGVQRLPADFRPSRGGWNRSPDWYKRAVFYEVLVRAFYDSNGDGTGDLRGLIEKLDYLAWLGVDCLWLPPFYDSPLRDGGYDIADYRKVLPEFGTVAGLRGAAGRRPRARHPGHHRPGDEPHQSTATRGSRSPAAIPTGRTATSTSGPTTTPATRTPGSSSWTPSRATGRSTRCASSTSGTGSSPTSPT